MSAAASTGVPGRLAVPTCIGCGAMSRPGTCETGCSERRRDLVRADACDWLDELADRARRRADALRPLVGVIAAQPEDPAGVDAEAILRDLAQRARDELRGHPDADAADGDLSEPPDAATTWWCDRCGGLDAPQDCLGICIWRSIDWVDAAVHEQARERARAEREQERRLRQVLRHTAYVHPRAGGSEATRLALRAQARRALGEGPPR